ncbi:MAG: polysaccharide deacetylase family protein [Bacteroidales bacterium]|jgi:peptidoglycan/xylan/chitin deacetylase (PgdA/CDA1 family)|nr:polysaccharide deacetylase family protein [Bacteroidales bacterium]
MIVAWIIIGIIFLVLPLCLFVGTYFLRLGFFVKVQFKIATKEKTVMLTFDDGPDPVQTPKILNILKANNVKAMFFLIGENAEKYPDIVKQIIEDGHLTGNHSYSHRGKFPVFSFSKMMNELEKTDRILENITGKKNIYFRPPFGITTPKMGKVIRQKKYRVIGWSIRSYDTYFPLEKSLKRTVKQLHPGAIVLLHDRLDKSDVLLEKLLKELSAKGYSTNNDL